MDGRESGCLESRSASALLLPFVTTISDFGGASVFCVVSWLLLPFLRCLRRVFGGTISGPGGLPDLDFRRLRGFFNAAGPVGILSFAVLFPESDLGLSALFSWRASLSKDSIGPAGAGTSSPTKAE